MWKVENLLDIKLSLCIISLNDAKNDAILRKRISAFYERTINHEETIRF